MADVKDEVEELEELLVGLETEEPMEAYSEDDDAVTLSMAAPIGDQEWMVQLSPTNRKMMSTDRVVTELGLGTLDDTTLVWRGGMEAWQPIAEVEDLTRARSSVPPPRPVPAPLPALAPPPALASLPALAPLPAVARASEGTPEEDTDDGDDGSPDISIEAAEADEAEPLEPAAAETASSAGKASQPPPPRSYTGRPVAVDFSAVPPKRPASLRMLIGAGGAAAATVLVTLFSLSRGGVFETTTSAAPEARSVSPLAPAPAAAAAEGSPAPAAPAPEPAQAAASEVPAPAAADTTNAEQPAPQIASSDAPDMDDDKPSTSKAKARARARMKLAKRARGSTSEAAGAAPLEAEEAKRAKPAARSKTRAVAAKAAVEEPSDDAEEAAEPAPGPTVGFNRQAAKDALKAAASQAANCRPAGGPTGNGKVQVRYDATGKVGSVSILTPGFENTTTGSCIQMVFRRAKIASFSGAPVVMTEPFEIK